MLVSALLLALYLFIIYRLTTLLLLMVEFYFEIGIPPERGSLSLTLILLTRFLALGFDFVSSLDLPIVFSFRFSIFLSSFGNQGFR